MVSCVVGYLALCLVVAEGRDLPSIYIGWSICVACRQKAICSCLYPYGATGFSKAPKVIFESKNVAIDQCN